MNQCNRCGSTENLTDTVAGFRCRRCFSEVRLEAVLGIEAEKRSPISTLLKKKYDVLNEAMKLKLARESYADEDYKRRQPKSPLDYKDLVKAVESSFNNDGRSTPRVKVDNNLTLGIDACCLVPA